MKLKYCTITGADDQVDPEDLAVLSGRYPFVEWGILCSKDRMRQSRYPSQGWIDDFIQVVMEDSRTIYPSLHICGEFIDRFLQLDPELVHLAHCFGRIQLNKKIPLEGSAINELFRCIYKYESPVIVQVNRENQDLWMHLHTLSNFHVLFDESRGNGIKASGYNIPLRGNLCGYAGGLGPDNLQEELRKIERSAGDREVWIDMETRVRTNDRLDLDKVEQVLKIVKEYRGVDGCSILEYPRSEGKDCPLKEAGKCTIDPLRMTCDHMSPDYCVGYERYMEKILQERS